MKSAFLTALAGTVAAEKCDPSKMFFSFYNDSNCYYPNSDLTMA